MYSATHPPESAARTASCPVTENMAVASGSYRRMQCTSRRHNNHPIYLKKPGHKMAKEPHLVMYLNTSSTRMTGNANHSTASHSDTFSAVTDYMAAAGGTWSMEQCDSPRQCTIFLICQMRWQIDRACSESTPGDVLQQFIHQDDGERQPQHCQPL